MARWTLAFLGLVSFLAGTTQAHARSPEEVDVAEGGDHYYHFGEWEEGLWLWLRRDGSYVEVKHNDMQAVTTADRGRWRFRKDRLILDSALRARDIETPEFVIAIHNDCGASLLPELREKLTALQQQPWKPGTNLNIGVGWVGASSLSCGIGIESVSAPADGTVLGRVIDSIDAYKASAEPNRFAYSAYRYGAYNFLIPSDPGPGKLDLSLAQAVSETDAGGREGWLPQLVYIEVPREQFEQIDSCDFRATTGRCGDVVNWLCYEWSWISRGRDARSLWWQSLFPGPQPATSTR